MKLKNLYFAFLTAYALGGTNTTHGSQRFMNLARYATAMAARYSQPFQTVKEHKPVKWIMDHKIAVAGAGITAGLVANEAFELTDYSAKNIILETLIKRKINALFASQGIIIKINNLSPDYRKSSYTDFLAEITRFEKIEKANKNELLFFFLNNHSRISPIDNNTIARTFLNSCDRSIYTSSINSLFRFLSNNEDKINCMKQLIEKEVLVDAYGFYISLLFNELPPDQRAPLASLFLKTSFDALSIQIITSLLQKLPLQDKVNCINRLIDSKKMESSSFYEIDQIFNILDPEQQIPLLSFFLEKSFDALHIQDITSLLEKLPLEDKTVSIKRLIENKILEKAVDFEIDNIFDLLPSEQKVSLLCLFFETSLDELHWFTAERVLKNLTLEDRILCIKHFIENGKLQKDFLLKNIIDLAKERSSLSLLFIEKYFDALNYYDITKLIDYIVPEDKINFIKQLIENGQLETKSWVFTDTFFSGLSSEIKSELALLLLEEYFDTLDEDCNNFLISQLCNTPKKKWYAQKLIETKNIEFLDPQHINALFLNFPEKERSDLASLFLKRSFNTLLESGTLAALPTIMSQLSCKIERADYLYQVIESKKIESFDAYTIDTMFKSLSPEAQAQWALLLLEESYVDLQDPNHSFINLIQYCPEGLKGFWFEEFAKKNKLLGSFISELTQGPFFSFEFILNHHQKIMSVLDRNRKEEAETLIKNAAIFAEKEYAKGNLVLFHGQHDQWAFFEKTFKALLKIKYNKITPENFTWLRFTEQALLSDTEVAEIQKDGVTRQTYNKYRPKVLFTNLHLLANHPGSNSLDYVLSNSDQTADDFFDFTIIENQFVELGMEQEYEQLQEEDPLLFKKLYDLYKKEVVARGNIGRLVGISLPKDIASKLCYATASRASLKPHLINGEQTTDITKIAEFYDQVGFYNEHALLLSDLFTNPEKAAKAGVFMETVSSEPTEESKKYAAELEAEFAKTMNHVEQVHKECMTSIEQK